MTECQSCTRPAQMFLCATCEAELRDMLASLPEWIECLSDVVLRRERLSDSSGHRKRGDELPAPYEPDTENGRSTRQGQASALLITTRNHLTTWIRHLCETRGNDVPSLPGIDQQATWLAEHTDAIAADEDAGACHRDINNLIQATKRIADRPPQPRFCGPCPHYIDHGRHCGRLLYARPGIIEIACPTCRTTHNIERLTRSLVLRADVMRFTSPEILMIMHTLGTPIPERSWRRWRTDKRVKIRGYKRPDNPDGTRGAIVWHRKSDADEPVYRLADVRKVAATAIRHTDAVTSEKTPV